MAVTETKAWRTSDGQIWTDVHEANVHEAKLDLVRRLKESKGGGDRHLVGNFWILGECLAEWALENVEVLDHFIADWRNACART